MIPFLAKIIVALNCNSRPSELASGIAFGFWLALIPGGNLLGLALLVIAFFLKHNVAAMLVSMGLFKLFIFLFDPLLDSLGGGVLELSALHSLFTSLYSLPLAAYTNFNNTLVMGGFLLGIILWVPIFLLFLTLVKLYRGKLADKLAGSRIIKTLRRLPFISKLAGTIKKVSALV